MKREVNYDSDELKSKAVFEYLNTKFNRLTCQTEWNSAFLVLAEWNSAFLVLAE